MIHLLSAVLLAGPGVPRGDALLLPRQRPEGGHQVHPRGLGRHRRGRDRHLGGEVPPGHEDAVRALLRPLRAARELPGAENGAGRKAAPGPA